MASLYPKKIGGKTYWYLREMARVDGKPAYRCRHGYTSATSPDSGRLKNTYIREDQILPHLAAIGILLASPAGTPGHGNRGLGAR